MKKLSLLFILALGFTSAFAQVLQTPSKRIRTDYQAPKVRPDMVNPFARYAMNKTNAESQWINYPRDLSTYLGTGFADDPNNRTAPYLTPDSLMYVVYTGNTFGSWYLHGISQVIDPKSAAFSFSDANGNPYTFGTGVNYSIDSMGFFMIYNRRIPDASIVDTLLLYVYTNQVNSNLPTYSFTGKYPQDNFGVDTLSFKATLYNKTLLPPNDITPDAKNFQVYKFPLTEADSSDFDTSGSTYFKTFVYAINSLNVPFNKLAACQVSFKPGYSYNLMDTLTTKNTLRFGSWQEADNAYPTYVSGDWNVSGILITDVRYNLDPNWNGFYIPTYAYTAPYSLEHHDIWWKVSALNVGMKDIDANGNALGYAYPNPTNDLISIPFKITSSQKLTLKVYDASGKEVATVANGQYAAGDHTLTLGTSELPAGLYYYTLTSGNYSNTRKFSVVR